MRDKFEDGISLIVLVITIIIIIIIAGAIILSLNNSNIITKAKEATFKANAQQINSELEAWILDKSVTSDGSFNPDLINLDNINKTYEGQNLSQILKSIKGEDLNKYQVVNGKLTYIGAEPSELEIAKEIGISTNLPYIKEGLVLWYDGVNNGGFGTHNSNESENKNIWKDLSEKGNDITISGMNFVSDNGWRKNGLVLNGTSCTITSNNPLKNQTTSEQSYTVEIVFEKKSTGVARNIYGINSGFYVTYGEKGLNYINSGSYDHYAYSNTVSQINEIRSYSGTYLKNSSTTNVTMYTNGGDKNNGSYYTSTLTPSGMKTTLNYYFNNSVVYSIRIYDRCLAQGEIVQNYNLDKIRFGIK